MDISYAKNKPVTTCMVATGLHFWLLYFPFALLLSPSFPYINIAVEILELDFLAATVDRAFHVFIDFNAVFSAFAAIIFHCLLRRAGSQIDVKVAVNLAVVRAHAHIGF